MMLTQEQMDSLICKERFKEKLRRDKEILTLVLELRKRYKTTKAVTNVIRKEYPDYAIYYNKADSRRFRVKKIERVYIGMLIFRHKVGYIRPYIGRNHIKLKKQNMKIFDQRRIKLERDYEIIKELRKIRKTTTTDKKAFMTFLKNSEIKTYYVFTNSSVKERPIDKKTLRRTWNRHNGRFRNTKNV
jgi:hypothetical protein